METQVIRNELNSPMLKWLNDDNLHDELISIFQEIKILTGAIMHTGESLHLQVRVLKLFLLSAPQFITLTTNEIRHAFYLNNQGEFDEVYRHYNKELNAEFMGDVLRAYLKYKQDIYRKTGDEIKAMIDPPAEAPRLVKPSEAEYQMIIQRDYNSYLAGALEFIFVSNGVYSLLRRYGAIQLHSRQHWHKLIGYAISERMRLANASMFKKDAWEKENILRLKGIYDRYQLEGWVPPEEFKMIIHTVHKNQYFRFFKTMQYFNIKNIFTEIKCK